MVSPEYAGKANDSGKVGSNPQNPTPPESSCQIVYRLNTTYMNLSIMQDRLSCTKDEKTPLRFESPAEGRRTHALPPLRRRSWTCDCRNQSAACLGTFQPPCPAPYRVLTDMVFTGKRGIVHAQSRTSALALPGGFSAPTVIFSKSREFRCPVGPFLRQWRFFPRLFEWNNESDIRWDSCRNCLGKRD